MLADVLAAPSPLKARDCRRSAYRNALGEGVIVPTSLEIQWAGPSLVVFDL